MSTIAIEQDLCDRTVSFLLLTSSDAFGEIFRLRRLLSYRTAVYDVKCFRHPVSFSTLLPENFNPLKILILSIGV